MKKKKKGKKKKTGEKWLRRIKAGAGWEAAIRYRNARNSRRKYREKRLFCRGSPLYAAAGEDGETRARFPWNSRHPRRCVHAGGRVIQGRYRNSKELFRLVAGSGCPRGTRACTRVCANDPSVRALTGVASPSVPRFENGRLYVQFREN